ncbi:MAG: YbaN family protein [Planctomycetota bacterium]|nr:YbaN family protein [Planctomycetota bacterium]MDP6504902.1 YbaN family protein [Planctomycetota bacterium]
MNVPALPPNSPKPNSIYRWALIILGSVSVGFGFIGIFVPLLPTTPFLLLAAACYFKSSEKFYSWLINHKWLGPYLRNYREGKRFSGKQKAALVIMIALTVISSVLLLKYFSS